MQLARILLLSSIIVSLASSCSNFSKILESKDYNYKFKKANEFYDKKKYEKAKVLYRDLLYTFKATEQYEFIFYRIAYCTYYLGEIVESQLLFKEYLSNFPNSSKFEEVDYMLAFSHYLESPNYTLDQSNTFKAINLMQIFINNYPNSDKVKEAQKIILECMHKLETKDFEAASLYYDAGQYKAAAIYYNQMVNDFSESPNAEEYKYKCIESLYRYAGLSVKEKQVDRYQDVLKECDDFSNRFPESSYLELIKPLINNSINQIKTIKNELATTNK